MLLNISSKTCKNIFKTNLILRIVGIKALPSINIIIIKKIM